MKKIHVFIINYNANIISLNFIKCYLFLLIMYLSLAKPNIHCLNFIVATFFLF